MSSGLAITVFTPTYNRAGTLPRVRESLLRQSLDPGLFEWVIVDDGSTDGTRELVQSWKTSAFPIRYSWQPNSGKHVAWNRAAVDARGELFAVLDSDDACVPHALERLVSLWAAVPEERRRTLAGILARCQTPDGVPVGSALPNVDIADFAELSLVRRLPSEAWMTGRTDIFRANPFPELRVAYLPEGALWHKIGRQYKWLIHDECLRIYFTETHGRGDQISCFSWARYPAGMAIAHQSVLDYSMRLFWRAPAQFARSAVHFPRFSMHAGLPIREQIAALEHPGARALCWSLSPLAYALYFRDKYRMKAAERDQAAST